MLASRSVLHGKKTLLKLEGNNVISSPAFTQCWLRLWEAILAKPDSAASSPAPLLGDHSVRTTTIHM
jgi:hypothetical protein